MEPREETLLLGSGDAELDRRAAAAALDAITGGGGAGLLREDDVVIAARWSATSAEVVIRSAARGDEVLRIRRSDPARVQREQLVSADRYAERMLERAFRHPRLARVWNRRTAADRLARAILHGHVQRVGGFLRTRAALQRVLAAETASGFTGGVLRLLNLAAAAPATGEERPWGRWLGSETLGIAYRAEGAALVLLSAGPWAVARSEASRLWAEYERHERRIPLHRLQSFEPSFVVAPGARGLGGAFEDIRRAWLAGVQLGGLAHGPTTLRMRAADGRSRLVLRLIPEAELLIALGRVPMRTPQRLLVIERRLGL